MPTNLQVIRPSRKKPQAGDLFRLRPLGAELHGRVIATDAVIGPMRDVILIYVYEGSTAIGTAPSLADLRPPRLLTPPIMTNRLPWSRGYFETIENLEMTAEDRLAQHCFCRASIGTEPSAYFDEYSNRLPHRVEPLGEWGLHSYRTIDDAVSTALGLPLAPDE